MALLALVALVALVALMTLVALVMDLSVAPDALGNDVTIADGERDLDFVKLVPLGVGALPFGDREKLLETCAGRIRRLLRFGHAVIIACWIREDAPAWAPW